MPRKASSVSELAQIERVRALLHEIGVTPTPNLEVITASGKTYVGQLLRDLIGNTPKVGGWNSYGVLTLATERGKIEIDYLDVVTVQKALQSKSETQPYMLGFRGRKAPRAKVGSPD
jgi:hypothetical protein